jgi:hypothetical protein
MSASLDYGYVFDPSDGNLDLGVHLSGDFGVLYKVSGSNDWRIVRGGRLEADGSGLYPLSTAKYNGKEIYSGSGFSSTRTTGIFSSFTAGRVFGNLSEPYYGKNDKKAGWYRVPSIPAGEETVTCTDLIDSNIKFQLKAKGDVHQRNKSFKNAEFGMYSDDYSGVYDKVFGDYNNKKVLGFPVLKYKNIVLPSPGSPSSYPFNLIKRSTSAKAKCIVDYSSNMHMYDLGDGNIVNDRTYITLNSLARFELVEKNATIENIVKGSGTLKFCLSERYYSVTIKSSDADHRFLPEEAMGTYARSYIYSSTLSEYRLGESGNYKLKKVDGKWNLYSGSTLIGQTKSPPNRTREIKLYKIEKGVLDTDKWHMITKISGGSFVRNDKATLTFELDGFVDYPLDSENNGISYTAIGPVWH